MREVRYFNGNATARIGRIEVTTLLDGWLSLDGGAMYGVVPKTLWEQQLPADARNRVRMAMRPLLVRTPGHTLVIESGIGQAIAPELHDRYGIDRAGPTLDELVRALGVDPASVDTVACTHLHWDHAGGLCRLENGAYRPTFPDATYVAQKGEWEIATRPTNLHKASYAPDSLLPLAERGRLRLVEGDAEIVPGVRFEFTNGHTENHAVIWLEDQGQSGCFLGDLVPTASHVPLAWISAYDINAGGSWRAREALYPKLVQRNARVFFYHEPEYPVGRVTKDHNRYRAILDT
ncbi:MAG: MBL fold metallo-hydrolase [Planctomycetes bacterium]|jgi:glyoxylase-like metal-dependent hydrolase (beta-lactamase superfamily II)|nr:MBL fold metallo-hydrolase [Planctomycetota bacterium]MCL4728991.1 MBL fold metallo-hydrolase [Planctomycetota bacterium]